MRLFSYLMGTKLRVAGAGIIAVAIFSFFALFPFNSVHAAGSNFDKETDASTMFKAIKFYQAIKYCAAQGQYKTTISGDDVSKGPRWWVADTTRVTIGISVDQYGDKNGLTSCAGDDDQNGWQDDAYEMFGYDPDGGEATLKKMGYSCSIVKNKTECKKDDINSTITGLMENSSYLKGTSIGLTNGSRYKVATYKGAINTLKNSCEASKGGNTNLYKISVVNESGVVKEESWSIKKSSSLYAGVDPITTMSSQTDYCRTSVVNAINDNAKTYAGWQSKAMCAENYPQLASSDSKLTACGNGRANAADVTYCAGSGITDRNSCFIGAGNPKDANGRTAGELCMDLYSGKTAELAACIQGAMHLADASYCNTNYPAPDSLNASGNLPTDTNKSKRDACAAGASLNVDGGGVVLSDSDAPEDPNADTTATACVVDGIGWMVCPMLNALGGLGDAMYGWIDSVLRLQPLTVSNGDGTESSQFVAWQSIRNIANVLLVIAFLIIIFSQLTSMGVTNYGVKKTLPRLIIVALAINTSFYIMAIAVDLTNIIGVGLHSIFSTLAPDATAATMNANEIIGAFVTGTGTVAVAGTAVAIAAGTGALSLSTLALMALPVVGVAVLALLAAVATLFIRNALIVILIVISPLAFAAYLLPNTQSMFTKWRKLFVSMLVLFPMAALLFGGAKFAASVVVVSDQPLSALAAIFIMAAPLGMLPWLVKSSNSLLGNIGGKLGGLARRARNPLNKAVEGQVNKQREAYRAGQKTFFGRKQKEGKTNVAQRWNNRRMSREAEIGNLKGESEENWREMAISGTGGGKNGKAAARAQAALKGQQDHATLKGRNDARAQEMHTARINTPGSVIGQMDTEAREAKLATARNEAQTQARFDQRVQNSAALTNTQQATRRAEEVSKTVKAEQDHAFEQVKSTDATLLGLRDRQADAQLKTSALTERSAVETQRRQQADPGLLNIRLDTEASKKERGALEQDITRQVAEGATDVGGAELVGRQISAADQAAMQSIVDRLKTAQVSSSVATSATTSAQNVQQQEHSTELMQNAALAVDAGGIDPRGESRVKAAANAVITDATNKAISAEKSTMTRAVAGARDGSDPDSLWSIVRDDTASVERRAAAAGQIMKTAGDGDIHELFEYVGDLSEPTLDSTSRLFIQQQMSDDMGGRKPVSIGAADAAALGTGTYSGNFDSKVTGRLSAGKLSPENLYATSADELQRMVQVLSDPSFVAQDPNGTPPGTGAANLAELKLQIENYKKSPSFKPASPEIAALIDQLEAEI